MFASALVAYYSSFGALSVNVRLRWEYQPGSDVIIVYGEGRDTMQPRSSALVNRAVIVTLNRLFRR